MLLGHTEFVGLRVVRDLAARRLRSQPLAHVALVGARYGRQFRGLIQIQILVFEAEAWMLTGQSKPETT